MRKMKTNQPGTSISESEDKSAKNIKDLKGSLHKLMNYFKPYRNRLLMVVLFAFASTLLLVLLPKLLGLCTDLLFMAFKLNMNHQPGVSIHMHKMVELLILLIGIALISSLFSYAQEYIMAKVSQKMIEQLRNDVSEKLHRLPLSFFDKKTYGEILSRVTNDIDTISVTLQESLTQLITSIFTLIGITVMMLIINPVLSLVAFLVLPVSFLVSTFIVTRSQKFYNEQQSILGSLNGQVEQMYGGHTVVKAFNYESKSKQDFDTTNLDLFKNGWKAQFVSSIIFPILNFLSNFAFIGVCVLGGYYAATGVMTLGAVQAFLSYSRQFNYPILQAANVFNIFQSTIAAAERVFELLDEKEEIAEIENSKIIERPHGMVVFKDVSFAYSPEKPLIEHVNICVAPGQLVAIVGVTGAGKTTLVNLLMRFYEIDAGSILVDDCDIKEMTRKDLRSLFGMVLQDAWLFNGTIRDNIAYGKLDATEAEIVKAAETALADSFIRKLPQGYDTVINEEGGNISQGQKQLLTIARALIANPKILILDEATSSVDTRTEVLIQNAMARLMSNRTSFVIAHRLSTIRDADCILVIDNGRIVEQGSHSELLYQDKFYAKLYNSQFLEQQ